MPVERFPSTKRAIAALWAACVVPWCAAQTVPAASDVPGQRAPEAVAPTPAPGLRPADAAAPAVPASPLPGFAQLEAAGARIGRITVRPLEVFDTEDPRESNWLFRTANALHITTRPSVIERALLFRTGDPVSVHRIEETERLLRGARFLYDVSIRPVAVNDGVVDVEVVTRDTWTLDPGVTAGRSGGANSSSVSIKEYNLLGTGVGVSFGRSNTVDRSGNEFQIGADRVLGTWVSAGYLHANNDDGRREAIRLVRPFYALDARWAAGVVASRDDRVDPVYQGGQVIARYRREEERAEVFGGRSRGLVDGWVQRWSAGVSAARDAYAPEPGFVAPPVLAPDETLVAPFVRWEVIEDRIVTARNLNQIGRPEFLTMGWQSLLQLGWAAPALGSTREALLYSGRVSRGFEPGRRQVLLASGTIDGRLTDAGIERQRLGGALQWHVPVAPGWVFYLGAAGDVLTRPGPLDMLTLGGDNGLRGYPLRYQTGTQRALFTVEQRHYTDLYPFRLFRVGAAAFADLGRAWGGPNAGPTSDRWLADVGIGLRIFSVRSAFSNALHLDIAFPIDGDADTKRIQFLVKTRVSF
ncbi:MAG: hypothetical protein RJA99_2762 [Pseudomonadota bacterium]|jgi:hypothetical protein